MGRQPLTVVLNLPDHDLTLNRAGTNNKRRARLVREHKEAAMWVGMAAVHFACRPWFPEGTPLVAVCRVERLRGGKRWDFGGMIEALKPAFDGLQGTVYPNDKQVVGAVVLWDWRPTGTGIVRVTFREWRETDG